MKGYSTREVAELLTMTPRSIREIARGIIDVKRDPNSPYQFSFQDIVLLRTAKELVNTGVSQGRINRTLLSLQRQLPHRALTSLRITGDGGAVVIRNQDHVYNPESGQLHFNFTISDLAGAVAPLARQAAQNASQQDHLTSDDWFDLGVDLEAVTPEDAPAAYLRALELDPNHADAHVNLGRLMQESNQPELAEAHYVQALTLAPDHPFASFNLGTLLEDMGRFEDAIIAYKHAGAFADAHYNLSRLYEVMGEHLLALSHLKTYKALSDSW